MVFEKRFSELPPNGVGTAGFDSRTNWRYPYAKSMVAAFY